MNALPALKERELRASSSQRYGTAITDAPFKASRDGTTFTMHVLFRINDGTQNLDKIVFNAFTRELTHDVFIVK